MSGVDVFSVLLFAAVCAGVYKYFSNKQVAKRENRRSGSGSGSNKRQS